MPLPEALLSVREAASLLRLSTATVYKLIDAGKIRHCRISNAIRFRREDLDEYIRGQRL
jgi:excisionase family DNA binding protein